MDVEEILEPLKESNLKHYQINEEASRNYEQQTCRK